MGVQTMGEIRQAADASRLPINLGRLEVAPSIYDNANRGLQAALMYANKNFTINNGADGKKEILGKLQGNMKDRYGWDEIAKASREERNLSGNKQKKPEWKNDIFRWLGEMEKSVPATYKLNNEILHKMLNIPSSQVGIMEGDLENLAKLIRNPAEGMRLFINAAVNVEGLDTNPGIMAEARNLAGALFGEKVSGAIFSQIAHLELSIQKGGNLDSLAAELFDQGQKLDTDNNLEAVYMINELNKLIISNADRLKKIQQKMFNKEQPEASSHIAQAKILGGRPVQQDYTRVTEKGLPKGADSISILTDGHGKDGRKSGILGAQFFEAKLIDIMHNSPTIAMESAIKQAIQYADTEVIAASSEGGGAAFAAVIKMGQKVYVINVGDCRVHQISPEGEFTTLTKDHRWEAEGGPTYKYDIQLSRTLGNGYQKAQSGGEITAEPDITVLNNLPSGTRLVLVSDGVTLTREEFLGLVRNKSAQDGVNEIMNAMTRQDPKDNASAIVVEI